MAEKRLFSKKIIESDAFLEMQSSTKCLYIYLGINADDDGFVGAPKGIMRLSCATKKNLEELIDKRFIIQFESGVVVIKHWFAQNYIPKDRYTPTTHIKERSLLEIDENKVYIEKEKADRKYKNPVDKLYTECIQNDDKMYTQNKLNKSKVNYINTTACARVEEGGLGEYENVFLSEEEIADLRAINKLEWMNYVFKLSEYIKETGKKYASHYAVIKKWMIEDLGV